MFLFILSDFRQHNFGFGAWALGALGYSFFRPLEFFRLIHAEWSTVFYPHSYVSHYAQNLIPLLMPRIHPDRTTLKLVASVCFLR